MQKTTWEQQGRSQESYKLHRELEYNLPRDNLPLLLRRAYNRLGILMLSRQSWQLPWQLRSLRSRDNQAGATKLAVTRYYRLLHRHIHKRRLRRNQGLHSLRLVLSYLIGTANVQTHNKPLTFCECARVNLDQIARATGLSRTAAATAHGLALDAGLIRQERRRIMTAEGYTEAAPRRWLTPHLFALLGLQRYYYRQAGYRRDQQQRPPTLPDWGVPAPAEPRAHRSEAATQAIADMRARLGIRAPP